MDLLPAVNDNEDDDYYDFDIDNNDDTKDPEYIFRMKRDITAKLSHCYPDIVEYARKAPSSSDWTWKDLVETYISNFVCRAPVNLHDREAVTKMTSEIIALFRVLGQLVHSRRYTKPSPKMRASLLLRCSKGKSAATPCGFKFSLILSADSEGRLSSVQLGKRASMKHTNHDNDADWRERYTAAVCNTEWAKNKLQVAQEENASSGKQKPSSKHLSPSQTRQINRLKKRMAGEKYVCDGNNDIVSSNKRRKGAEDPTWVLEDFVVTLLRSGTRRSTRK